MSATVVSGFVLILSRRGRNPLIAETLYRSEDIEKWGSGLRRISEECKATGVKVAFEKIKSGFMVTFYRPGIIQEQARSLVTETVPEGKRRQWGVSEEKMRRKYGEDYFGYSRQSVRKNP